MDENIDDIGIWVENPYQQTEIWKKIQNKNMIFISKNLYLYTMLYYGLLNGKIEYGMRPFEGCESIEITEPGNKTVYVIKGETYYGDVFKSIIISDNYLNGLEKLDEIILKVNIIV